MDWTTLITALSGILTGGIAGSFLNRKQIKASGTADAIVKAAEAMEKMLVNASNQQETFNNIIDQKDATIGELYNIIAQKDKMIEENEASILKLKRDLLLTNSTISEHSRIIKGLQAKRNEDEGRKKYAERIVCFNEDCPERIPRLGTYKMEEAGSD